MFRVVGTHGSWDVKGQLRNFPATNQSVFTALIVEIVQFWQQRYQVIATS